MKKLMIVSTVVLSVTINLFAEEIQISNGEKTPDRVYDNFREGKSSLISSIHEEEIRNKYHGNPDLKKLQFILTDRSINRCATKLVSKFKHELGLSAGHEIEEAILGLRLYNGLDDVSASILLRVNEMATNQALPMAKDELSQEEENQALTIFKELDGALKNPTNCSEDTYRDVVSKLYSKSPKFAGNLKHLLKVAKNEGILSTENYKIFEVYRMNKVHQWPLTLSSYAQSLEALAKKFNKRIKESSDLITQKKFRQKNSMRLNLFNKFSSTQIILLANIVKDLKTRLESKDVKITIDYEDRPSETIELSPMEKFRFILKLLRKELSAINNSTLLEGNQASYLDLISAAYEVGYISSSEIEMLSSLQDIWNPQKTPKEKVLYWLKSFGGITSILLPAPFGFVSVMAIMLIDQQIKDAPINRDLDFNLF